MARAVVRTMKLSRPALEADRELDEIEFREPTSAIFDELETASTWNENAKKRKDIVPTSLVILEHLTGLDGSTLKTLTFEDRKRANELAVEIMGAKLPGEA